MRAIVKPSRGPGFQLTEVPDPVVGPDDVLIQVKEEQLKAQGKEMDPEEREKLREEILKKYDEEGSPYFSTSRLWDDGIIDPVDTRKIIAMGIAMSLNNPYPEPKTGVYRM